MHSRTIVGLFGVGVVFYITNPTKKTNFISQLQLKAYGRDALIVFFANKGITTFDIFKLKSYLFFSVAKLDKTYSYNQSPFVAIGILNNWFFFELKERPNLAKRALKSSDAFKF
ncbi:hypothetical protein ACTFIZ_008506 [Dictyostelium cf. discoideum]